MEQFDWKAHLSDTFHSSFTLSGRRPVIGITGNYGEQTCKLAETYYKQVVKAGGTPLIIPPLSDKESVVNTLNATAYVSINAVLGRKHVTHTLLDRLNNNYATVEVGVFINLLEHPVNKTAKEATLAELNNSLGSLLLVKIHVKKSPL